MSRTRGHRNCARTRCHVGCSRADVNAIKLAKAPSVADDDPCVDYLVCNECGAYAEQDCVVSWRCVSGERGPVLKAGGSGPLKAPLFWRSLQ